MIKFESLKIFLNVFILQYFVIFGNKCTVLLGKDHAIFIKMHAIFL